MVDRDVHEHTARLHAGHLRVVYQSRRPGARDQDGPDHQVGTGSSGDLVAVRAGRPDPATIDGVRCSQTIDVEIERVHICLHTHGDGCRVEAGDSGADHHHLHCRRCVKTDSDDGRGGAERV